MELELGLNFLLQSLPAIAQIFTAMQEEKVTKIKHKQALEMQKMQSTRGGNRQENGDSQKGRSEAENLRKPQWVATNLASKDKKNKLQLAEVDKIIENWPLRLLPSQILASHSCDSAIPLRIFLLPPQVPSNRKDVAKFVGEIEPILAQFLSEFLNEHYSLNDPQRPTEFLASAWKPKRFHREASIKTLFEMLKSEPTLILESEIVGETLNFRIAYWGLGQKTIPTKQFSPD